MTKFFELYFAHLLTQAMVDQQRSYREMLERKQAAEIQMLRHRFAMTGTTRAL